MARLKPYDINFCIHFSLDSFTKLGECSRKMALRGLDTQVVFPPYYYKKETISVTP